MFHKLLTIFFIVSTGFLFAQNKDIELLKCYYPLKAEAEHIFPGDILEITTVNDVFDGLLTNVTDSTVVIDSTIIIPIKNIVEVFSKTMRKEYKRRGLTLILGGGVLTAGGVALISTGVTIQLYVGIIGLGTGPVLIYKGVSQLFRNYHFKTSEGWQFSHVRIHTNEYDE